MMRLRWLRSAFAVAVLVPLLAASSPAQSARILVAQAETESNPEKQVALLCKAADLEPASKDYRKNCDLSKAALLAGDKQRLKEAQDASDAGRPLQARRFALMVTSLDPDLHRQAEQLLNKLTNPAAANNATAANPATNNPPAANPPAKEPGQAATLAQATSAFESGNLAAARSAAQAITDPTLKPAADSIVSKVTNYNNLLAEGAKHQQAMDYAAAELSFRSAFALNSHVAGDDLANRVGAMRQAAQQGKNLVAANLPHTPPNPPKQPPELSQEEKKKRLIEESAALSKDPVQLEKTLREAIAAFYASDFETAESRFNRYLGADGGRKKGAAYFYLGATETTLALLNDASKRSARTKEAQENFKQARLAGYQPLDKYVSARVLDAWKSTGM